MNPQQLLDKERSEFMKRTRNRKWTPEEEKEYAELACRSMMISFFAYHGIPTIRNEESWFFQQYLQRYVKELGRKRFDEVRDRMIKSFEGATVKCGIYTDHEGCTYNSIHWAEV